MVPPRRSTLLMLLLFAAISVANTWPLVLDPASVLVTRHFDGFGALWLMDVAPDLGFSMRTDQAAWPHGQALRRADSQLMILLAKILGRWTGPVVLFNALVLVGPVLSAWAAERFSRRVLGAERPWSLLAGLAYGFCGLGATSILEGHAYFLLVPWLPLLATAWWRATGPEGSPRDGVAAGCWWVLCLLTSGYMGILGAILVLVGLPRAARSPAGRWRSLAAAAAVAVPIGLLYTVAFVTGGDEGSHFQPDAPVLGLTADAGLGATASQLQQGSSGLLQLVAVRLAEDGVRHAIAPILSLTALVLSLFAGRVLPATGSWRTFRWLGLAGMALSLGPMVETIEGPLQTMPMLERLLMGAPEAGATGGGPPWSGYPNLPWLLFPFTFLSGDVFFHFPYRFAWLAALGLGGVAAATATQLARQMPPSRVWLMSGLLVAGAWDATGRLQLQARAAVVPLDVPTAYTEIVDWPGGVLELWPRPAGGATDADLLMNNLTCTYQRVHGRPMVSACIGTGLDQSPRVLLSRWLLAEALDPHANPTEVRDQLAALGVGAVAVHLLFFDGEDRLQVSTLMQAALGSPEASSDGQGDPVRIYRVPAPAPRDQARAAWAASR